MKLNQPENKFKHVVFGYSNFGKVVRMAKVSIEIILLEIHIKILLSTWVEIMMDIQKVDITTILKQMAIVVKIYQKR